MHLLERARREHVDRQLQQLVVRDRSPPSKLGDRAAGALVREHRRDVEPARRRGARRVESETATTFAPASAASRANVPPTLPNPCTATVSPSSSSPAPAQRLEQAEDDAAAGRLAAADRAADRERLAGDDAEHRVALVHRERVEDPRHHLRVRADVGRRDVALGADLVDDLGGVAARHPLELLGRERLRVADDAALGAAERQVHQRALPRHPHRERLDLVERDGRVVADAALRRPARDVVRDAPAGEDAHAAVVHRRRDRDLDRLLAGAEDPDEVVVDAERVGHVLQLLLRHLQRSRSSGALDPEASRARGVGLPPSTGQATSRSWYAPGRELRARRRRGP